PELSPECASRDAARYRFVPYRFPVRDPWRQRPSYPLGWKPIFSHKIGASWRKQPQKLNEVQTKSTQSRSVLTDSYGCAHRRRRILASAGQETQYPRHYGRRHRLDAAELLSPRPDGRGNTQH